MVGLTREERARRAAEKAAQASGSDGAEKFPRTDSQRAEMKTTRARRSQRDALRLNFQVYGELPGYHLHGIPDDGGLMEAALQDGYEYVTTDDGVGFSSRGNDIKEVGGRVRIYGGTNEGGQPYYVYLMKIKEDMWKEITEERNGMHDELMQQITGGNLRPFDGQYKPARNIFESKITQ